MCIMATENVNILIITITIAFGLKIPIKTVNKKFASFHHVNGNIMQIPFVARLYVCLTNNIKTLLQRKGIQKRRLRSRQIDILFAN